MIRKIRCWIARFICPEAFRIKEQGDAILNYQTKLRYAIQIIKEKNEEIEKLKKG